jgi:hypothetical protein
MLEDKTFTLEEAHKHFATKTNGEAWKLLEKPDRDPSDNELLINLAHTSYYHWLQVGTKLNHQRAEWLLSHVYAEVGIASAALKHAQRCQELTEEFKVFMQDFDKAYAYEALARAYALSDNVDKAMYYIRHAEVEGQAIAGEEDRKIFLLDFNGGNWYGLK